MEMIERFLLMTDFLRRSVRTAGSLGWAGESYAQPMARIIRHIASLKEGAAYRRRGI